MDELMRAIKAFENTVATNENIMPIKSSLLNKDQKQDWAVYFGFLQITKHVISIAGRLVSLKNLGTPRSYSELISLLVNKNYLEQQTAEEILAALDIRNEILHGDDLPDVAEVYEFYMDNHCFNDFSEEITRQLTL